MLRLDPSGEGPLLVVNGGKEHLVDKLVLLLRWRQEEERVLQCLGSPPNVLLALAEQELLQIARCESVVQECRCLYLLLSLGHHGVERS